MASPPDVMEAWNMSAITVEVSWLELMLPPAAPTPQPPPGPVDDGTGDGGDIDLEDPDCFD